MFLIFLNWKKEEVKWSSITFDEILQICYELMYNRRLSAVCSFLLYQSLLLHYVMTNVMLWFKVKFHKKISLLSSLDLTKGLQVDNSASDSRQKWQTCQNNQGSSWPSNISPQRSITVTVSPKAIALFILSEIDSSDETPLWLVKLIFKKKQQ